MQTCSGFQGLRDYSPAVYALNPHSDDWTGVTGAEASATATANLSFWLRTYEESTGTVHVGVLDHDIGNDVPLGFLGASLDAASPALADMAGDMQHDVAFFRCADRMACTSPLFTYNGVQV